MTFHKFFNFFINDHCKYRNSGFYFQIDYLDERFLNFEIGNYFTLHEKSILEVLILGIGVGSYVFRDDN